MHYAASVFLVCSMQVRYNGVRGKWLQLTTSSGEATLGGEPGNCNADACTAGEQHVSSKGVGLV
jgi:hypothetical protein